MSGLVTQDFQIEFDGLLLGAGTPYVITSQRGFLDLSGVRAPMTQRARAHGGYVEPHYANGAILDLEFDISADTSSAFNAAVVALEANTYPQSATRPMWFQLPGHGLRLMQVQCMRRSIPIEGQYFTGYVPKAALQFYAPDPLKYGPTMNATTGLPSTTGGLPYPLSYPLAYGTTTAGRASASNVGSAASYPVFTVTGPHDNGFQITSVEDAIALQYNGAVGAADQVVIDTRTGSVQLNGTDRRSLLSFAGVWPAIPAADPVAGTPGVRTFAFTTLGATYTSPAPSLTVTWAPAYN